MTIKQYVNFLKKKINYKGQILFDKTKPNGTPRKKLDNSKLNNLGRFPKTALDQGLEITINSFTKELKENILRDY